MARRSLVPSPHSALTYSGPWRAVLLVTSETDEGTCRHRLDPVAFSPARYSWSTEIQWLGDRECRIEPASTSHHILTN